MTEIETLEPPRVAAPPGPTEVSLRRGFWVFIEENRGRWVWFVATAAFLLRLLYLFQVSRTPFYFPDRLDPLFYYRWAQEIAAGNWLGDRIFVQSPLYAYFVAVFLKLLGGRFVFPVLQIVQAMIGVGTCLLVIRIARWVGSEREAFLAGCLIAFYGPFLFYEGMVMKTFLSTFLTVLLVDLLIRSEGRAERTLVLSGIVFSLTALVRDNFVLLLPLVLAGFFFAFPALPRRGALRAALLFTAGAAAIILPVTVRNFVVGKEFALLTTGGGEVFYIGNNGDANGRYLPPPFVHATPEKEHDDFIAKASELAGRKLTPGESSSYWLRQGLSWIGSHPGAWAMLLVRKLVVFWNFYELPDNYNYYEVRQVMLSPFSVTGILLFPSLYLVNFWLIAPLGLTGIALTARRWRDNTWIYIVLFGYMGTVLLFFNFSRFRVPIVPFLCLFAASTLLAAGEEIHRWVLHFTSRPTDGEAEISPSSLPAPWRRYVESPSLFVAPILFLLLFAVVNLAGTGGRGVFPTVESKLGLGDAYRIQKRFDAAEKEYRTGLQILGEEPIDPSLIASLGVDPNRMRQEVESERMAHGVNFDTVRAGLHYGLGAVRVEQGKELMGRDRGTGEDRIRKGIEEIEKAAKIIPYAPYLRRLAEAQGTLGLSVEAEQAYKAAILLDPADFGTHYDLAGLYFEARRYPEAVAQIQEAKKAKPVLDAAELSDYHFGMGLARLDGFHQRGRALYHFEKALESDPRHREAERIQELIDQLKREGVKPEPED